MVTKRAIFSCIVPLALVAMVVYTSQTPTPSKQPVIDTSSSSLAPVSSESATTNGYTYGYGTYYVATRRDVPPYWGNAKMWYVHAQNAGYAVGGIPRKGAIAWTNRGPYGQVAIVEDVSADSSYVIISEMNGPGGWNQVTTRTAQASSYKYIY